jgi:hypothetical protein
MPWTTRGFAVDHKLPAVVKIPFHRHAGLGDDRQSSEDQEDQDNIHVSFTVQWDSPCVLREALPPDRYPSLRDRSTHVFGTEPVHESVALGFIGIIYLKITPDPLSR